MIFVVRKDIAKLIVIVFDRTSILPKAYKEVAKTKKKDYCDNGNDNGSCDSDCSNSNDSNDSSEEGSSGSDSSGSNDSDEDETLQVLMSMSSGMLKNARKGRSLYAE